MDNFACPDAGERKPEHMSKPIRMMLENFLFFIIIQGLENQYLLNIGIYSNLFRTACMKFKVF